MRFTCPKCYIEKEETEFPSCKELREAIAKPKFPLVKSETPLVLRVACNNCQQVMKKPSSLEFQQLVVNAWKRGEHVD